MAAVRAQDSVPAVPSSAELVQRAIDGRERARTLAVRLEGELARAEDAIVGLVAQANAARWDADHLAAAILAHREATLTYRDNTTIGEKLAYADHLAYADVALWQAAAAWDETAA